MWIYLHVAPFANPGKNEKIELLLVLMFGRKTPAEEIRKDAFTGIPCLHLRFKLESEVQQISEQFLVQQAKERTSIISCPGVEGCSTNGNLKGQLCFSPNRVTVLIP